MTASAPEPILQVRDLRKVYHSAGMWGRQHATVAVDGVSFTIAPGETFGLVGESGCGKSTVARCILNLIPPTSGEILFEGRDVLKLPPAEMRALRKQMQVVFQDPFSSLDPRMSVRATLLEPLEIHRVGNRAEREARVRELLEFVGLPESALQRYPHEFSGGQRQRIGIARALALSPRLIVADEPVSALDLSIRAQVLNLMMDLQTQFGLSYLFIAHDLTLVRQVCQRLAVMSRGLIVEMAEAEQIFDTPLHPYTQTLLAAIPEPDPALRRPRAPADGKWGEPPASGERETPTGAGEPTALVEAAPGHWVRKPGAGAHGNRGAAAAVARAE